MTTFTQKIQQQLAEFSPFLEKEVEISHHCFQLTKGKVCQFIQEIHQTCLQIEQHQGEKLAFFTEKLVNQFNYLYQVVHQPNTATPISPFKHHYHFSPNIHRLPKTQRLAEYRKALRALNEKLSWLTEQSYLCPISEKSGFIQQINETEQRKQRCLMAIEQLEMEKTA